MQTFKIMAVISVLIAQNGYNPRMKTLFCSIMILLSLISAATAQARLLDTELNLTPAAYLKQDAIAFADPYGRSLCHKKGFHCIAIKAGDSWVKLFPNYQNRELVMRLNRTNVALMYRAWIVVPNALEGLTYMSLAPFAKKIAAPGRKEVIVNLHKFAFAAYNSKGDLIYWGPAAGGKVWCSDLKQSCRTETGTHYFYRMHGVNCKSGTYPIKTKGGAPMPYCMYYYKGFALHGSTLTGFFNRSRGCIRLFEDDAKWLYERFVKYKTKVIVKS